MFKQVIVVNKRLDMSPGKLGDMVAHGVTSLSQPLDWTRNYMHSGLPEALQKLFCNSIQYNE